MSKNSGNFSWKDSISLREYFETILKEMREDYKEKVKDLHEKICIRFDLEEKAKDAAMTAMEKRLEGMNEFRDQLKDQTSTFITRETYEANRKITQQQIDELRLSKAELSGKASQSALTISYIISVIGIIMGLIGIILSL